MANFERTVWADRELAKLCPNNDIKRFGEVVTSDDFTKQIDVIISIIRILNEGYERKAHFLDKDHEINVISVEYLENLSEEELAEISNEAFKCFNEDAKTEINTKSTKKKDENPHK